MLFMMVYEFTQVQKDVYFSIEADGIPIVNKVFDGKCHRVEYEFHDSDDYRLIRISISIRGKTSQHTLINNAGEILSDCAALIKSISIDDVEVTELFCQGACCYEHDNNGSSAKFVDEFYGYIGCNGTVQIEFSVPLYRWFLGKCQ